MRASLKCWLGALPVAALSIALPLLLIGVGARSGPAPEAPRCGIAAWTGTCVCESGPHAAPTSFNAFASRASGDAAALDQARRQCGMPPTAD